MTHPPTPIEWHRQKYPSRILQLPDVLTGGTLELPGKTHRQTELVS